MKRIATKETRAKAPPPKASLPRSRSVQPRGSASADVAAAQPDPAHEQRVREAAYFIYERSGRAQGREFANWLLAEAEIEQLAAGAVPKGKKRAA